MLFNLDGNTWYVGGYRFIKHLVIYLAFCLPFMALGCVLLALALPFVKPKQEYLPRWLRWWDNASTYINGHYPLGDGLSGDPTYRKERAKAGHTNLFWERFYWLALRNPMNYFEVFNLGLTGYKTTRIESTSPTGRIDRTLIEGYSYTEARNPMEKKIAYQYYYVKFYTLFGKRRSIWFRWGWKLPHNLNESWSMEGWVFSLSLWQEVYDAAK